LQDFLVKTRAATPTKTKGHIVLGDDITEMRVMWAAKGEKLNSSVYYGLDSDSLEWEVTKTFFFILKFSTFFNWEYQVEASATTYGPEDMCGAKKGMDGYSYESLLKGLKPSTEYYYKFGSHENEFSFSPCSSLAYL